MRAYNERIQRQLEIAAFVAMHNYNAFSGKAVTIDELLGRGRRYDLVNDPLAFDRLKADTEGSRG